MSYRTWILLWVALMSTCAWADRFGPSFGHDDRDGRVGRPGGPGRPGGGPGFPGDRGRGFGHGHGARVDAPTVRGSGCPDGSVSVALSPDESAVTLIFGKYQVEAGGGGKGGLRDQKECDFRVPMSVPAGWSVAVNRVDYRGFNALPSGGMSEFRSAFGISGVREDRRSSELRQVFIGPLASDFVLSQNADSTVFSKCGEPVQLVLRTELRVQTNAAREQALSTIDSADLNSNRQTVYYLQWNQCPVTH